MRGQMVNIRAFLSVRFRGPDVVNSVSQDRLVNLPGRGDAPGGVIHCFLQQMSRVSSRPLPAYLVSSGGAIEPLPPRQVCFATKPPVHRFHDIT